jgi:RsiW-degrading membrane proteinase PrsW (M82 family)
MSPFKLPDILAYIALATPLIVAIYFYRKKGIDTKRKILYWFVTSVLIGCLLALLSIALVSRMIRIMD